MNPKTAKILKKSLFLLPTGILFGMAIILWIQGIDPFYWQIGILIGVGLTIYYMILNINDYNSIDEISMDDYLESNHTYKTSYDEQIWGRFKILIEQQFTNYKVYNNQPNEIIVKVEYSILKMTRNQTDLFLTIERKSFDFMPDRGHNYLLLKKIIKIINQHDSV